MVRKRRKPQVTIVLRPDLLQRVDRIAKVRKLSRSTCIEQLLSDAVDDTELAVNAFSDPVILKAMGEAFANRDVLRAMAGAVRAEMGEKQLGLFEAALQQVAGQVGPVKEKKKRK